MSDPYGAIDDALAAWDGGFQLLLVDAIGSGAREQFVAALSAASDERADLWRLDLRQLTGADLGQELPDAMGDLPTHDWMVCIEGLEELARAGEAEARCAQLEAASDALTDALPGLWLLFCGPESLPLLEAHAPNLLARAAHRVRAPWTPPEVDTTPGMMAEATPLGVALRPGAEGWVDSLARPHRAIVDLAQSGELEAADAALQRLRLEADLEVALSPAVQLLRAEIELELDRYADAARRLRALDASLRALPAPDPSQQQLHAICLLDLAVAQRILGDTGAAATLDAAEAAWARLDDAGAEVPALVARERGLALAAAGELRAALDVLTGAGKQLNKARRRIDMDTLVAQVHLGVALDERKDALNLIKKAFREINKEADRRRDRVAPLLLLSRGVLLLRQGDQRGASKALLGCVDGADALGPSAEQVRMRALTLLPALLIQEGRGDEALEQFEGVLAAADEIGASDLLIEALLEGSNTAIALGELHIAEAWAREGLSLAIERAGDRPDLLLAHAARAAGVAHYVLGEKDEARALLGQASALYGQVVASSAPLARDTRKLLKRC